MFLVLDKRDSKQYVLKKVECNDENDANKAFKEVCLRAWVGCSAKDGLLSVI